eukprot:scaffold18852_cov95-Isochrysis_galbana.AAC.5
MCASAPEPSSLSRCPQRQRLGPFHSWHGMVHFGVEGWARSMYSAGFSLARSASRHGGHGLSILDPC